MTEPLKFIGRHPDHSKSEKKPVGESNTGGVVITIEDLGKRRDVKINEIVDDLFRRELARTNPVLSPRRRRRNEIMEDLEDRWWQAHESGVKDDQRTIEEEIGRKLGLRKGGNFIYRLRTAAEIYENLDGTPEGANAPLQFRPRKPKE